MSIDQYLFFLILIAIPLLERLVRAMRARTDSPAQLPPAPPARRTPAPREAGASRPRPRGSNPEAGATTSERRRPEVPLPAASLPHALPQAIRKAAPEERLPGSEREPRVRGGRKHGPMKGLQARPPGAPVAVGGIARGDLRRAIVLIAVLGPCRALEPRDASQLR